MAFPFGVINVVVYLQHFIDGGIRRECVGEDFARTDNVAICGCDLPQRDRNLRRLHSQHLISVSLSAKVNAHSLPRKSNF